jgi:hypothetical protein
LSSWPKHNLARPENTHRTSWLVEWKCVVEYMVYRHRGETTPMEAR